MGRSTWVKVNRIFNKRRQPNKIPILKDCLSKLVQKQGSWMFATIKYHEDSDYSTPNTLNAGGVPGKGHTCTDLNYCTDTGYGRNIKLQSSSPPILSSTPTTYFSVSNIKISVTRKGSSRWQRRVYKKQFVGFHLEYCILYICRLFILHHTYTHPYACKTGKFYKSQMI